MFGLDLGFILFAILSFCSSVDVIDFCLLWYSITHWFSFPFITPLSPEPLKSISLAVSHGIVNER